MKTSFLILALASFSVWSQSEDRMLNAIREGKVEDVKALIASGVNPNGTVKSEGFVPYVVRATYRSQPEIVKVLLDHRADPNSKRALDANNGLMISARTCQLETAQHFLKAGVDINAKAFNNTALSIAAFNGCYAIVSLLLQQPHIDVNEGCPLADAERMGHKHVAELLKSQTGSKAPSEECLLKAQLQEMKSIQKSCQE